MGARGGVAGEEEDLTKRAETCWGGCFDSEAYKWNGFDADCRLFT